MALLPGFLFHAADPAVELWENLNVYAVKDISRRIADAQNHMTASAEWEIYKLQQAGMTREAIQKATQKLLGVSDEEVKNIFEEAVMTSHGTDADMYAAAGVQPEPFNTELARKQLQVYYEQTNGEMRNFTLTTADQAQQTYINACDGAFMAIQSGVVSPEEAIRQAIDDVASDGLYVTYPSGHKDTIEVAVRRAVQTGVNRASLQYTMDECDRMGTNYVLVSSHLGARVSDTNPIANHFGWQGKVYKLHPGRPGFIGKLQRFWEKMRRRDYPLLKDATGWPDDPLGLGGYNCRHSAYPYIPGVTENHMRQYDEKENRDTYDASQKQRAMERRMRKAKRVIEGEKSALNSATPETAEVLRESLREHENAFQDQLKEYKKFCEEKKLAPMMKRTYTANASASQVNIRIAKKQKAESLPTNYRGVGKLDKSLLEKTFGDLQTDEVVITEERIKHIRSRHPDAAKEILERITDVIEDPDLICLDERHEYSIHIIKRIKKEISIELDVRLLPRGSDPLKKNSIITGHLIDNKKRSKMERNRKSIYRKNPEE